MTTKDKVQVQIIVSKKKKRKRKLTEYQKFTGEFIKRTGGDMTSAAAAWNKLKKQTKGKDFEVNFK